MFPGVKRERWVTWIPVLVGLLIYLPTLGHGPVTDDRPLIIENPYLHRWSGIVDLFTRDLWEASAYGLNTQFYRPLPMASFWLQVQLLGDSIPLLRLGNVVLHAASAGLLARLLTRQWSSLAPGRAAMVAAAWAAHPLNSESVIWLSGRFDLLLVLLALLSLWFNLGARRRWAVPLSVTACLFSKEVSIVLIPVLGFQDWGRQRSAREEWPKYLRVVLAFLLYSAVRWVLGIAGPIDILLHTDPAVLVRSYVTLVVTYGRLLVVPVGLDVHHWYRPVAWGYSAAVLVALAALLGLAARAELKQRSLAGGLASGLALSVLSLVPVALIGPNQQIFGDRFSSLAVLGLALSAPAVFQLAAWSTRGSVRLLGVATTVTWGALTVLRGTEWRSEHTLISAALQADPSHPFWRMLGAHALLGQGKQREALAVLLELTRDEPSYGRAWNALCVAQLRTGERAASEASCWRAARLDPESPSVWVNLASVFMAERRWTDAIGAAKRSLEHRADYAEAEYILAASYANLGQTDVARKHLLRGLTLSPEHHGLLDLRAQFERRGLLKGDSQLIRR